MSAKIVLGDAGIKRRGRDRVVTLQQAKITSPDEQMQETAHRAHAAIAPRRVDLCRRIYFETDRATMTPTCMPGHDAAFCQTAM